jgi:hypothetical protein
MAREPKPLPEAKLKKVGNPVKPPRSAKPAPKRNPRKGK